MSLNLFGDQPRREALIPGAVLLRGMALTRESELVSAIEQIVAFAPFRHMVTPGGFEMSVAMTNCGDLGWITDKTGYRYNSIDPCSSNNWPPMPSVFLDLARVSAMQAGFDEFVPDACLINRYAPGSRLTLHQDKNERDFSQPIVSVSLGIPAEFLIGGMQRSDRPLRVRLLHGDVVVWGGPARLVYHGIMPLAAGFHSLFGEYRINLTLRKAA